MLHPLLGSIFLLNLSYASNVKIQPKNTLSIQGQNLPRQSETFRKIHTTEFIPVQWKEVSAPAKQEVRVLSPNN